MESKSPLVFRLEPELHKRLEACAKQTRLKKYNLAILAIEAAVDAIEKNNYRLVVPIQFDVSHVPVPARAEQDPTRYPPHQPQTSLVEDKPSSSSRPSTGKRRKRTVDEQIARAVEKDVKRPPGQ